MYGFVVHAVIAIFQRRTDYGSGRRTDRGKGPMVDVNKIYQSSRTFRVCRSPHTSA